MQAREGHLGAQPFFFLVNGHFSFKEESLHQI